MKTDKNVEVKEVANGIASHTEIDLSRQSPGQMTDVSNLFISTLKINQLPVFSKSAVSHCIQLIFV